MNVMWMAVVAGLIAFEKTVPWRRVASYGTAAVLLALGVLALARETPKRPAMLTTRDLADVSTHHLPMSTGRAV
jgi:O-antigen ligase